MNRFILLPVIPLRGRRLPADLEFSYDGGKHWVSYDPPVHAYLLGYPDVLWRTNVFVTVTKPGLWFCCDCSCGPYPEHCRRCGCRMKQVQ